MAKRIGWLLAAVAVCFSIVGVAEAATTPSTTTLAPNTTTAYTSGAGSSVTLTANVTAGATGTVTFKDGATNLTCSGGNPAALSATTATCVTSFATEGVHTLSATYGGDVTFIGSSGTANVFIQNHAANVGTTYCNTGAISSTGQSNLAYTNSSPYPSVIFIGDGLNTDIASAVSTLSLRLTNFSTTSGALTSTHMLLMAPDRLHAFDFFSNVGTTASAGNYTFQDGASQVGAGPISPGTYAPTANGPPPDLFTPAPPVPAPQLPASFVYAPPTGTSTFQTAFIGAAAHGAWSLYLFDEGGAGISATAAGGWCLTITPATGHPTTTTLTSSPGPNAALGAPVTFTATVASSPTPNVGVVTFLENGVPLPGGTASVVNGVATLTTSTLSLGAHTITASYHDTTNVFNDSFGPDTITINPPPVLAISKAHTGTFTQGSSGTWTLTVQNNSATAAGATDGSLVTVTDTLPSGYTLQSVVSGSDWNCTSSTAAKATCTSTGVVAGAGGQFSAISLHVSIPANSPTSVTNTAGVFGGGDAVHTNSGSAATSSDTVSVIQVPSTISLTAGNNQSVAVGTAFPTNLSATVSDAGNVPISGVTVTFTAPASGASGTFAGGTNVKTALTNASGVATATTYSANTTAGGPYNISVAAGAASNNFSETNLPGLASQMTANAGTTPQSATISTAFTNALAVTVKDSFNNPVSGVSVTFTAPGSGASGIFSNNTATITVVTNASGVAAAPFTANATIGGPYTVTAAASGLTTVNFSLTNTVGAATSMTTNAGTTPQSATINTAFANALAVTVKDAGSNPVSGVSVTFTAPGSGASGVFSNNTATITVVTNASGVAAAPFTANATIGGPYTVTAAASGLTTVNFSLTNTVGAATSMTANAGTTPQSATVSTAFANALAVTVKDAGSNPVSGVSVTFAAPGSGASGVFGNSTATITVATNAAGVAAAPFTANGTAGGPYTVSAAASGLTTVNFSLTNTAAGPQITQNPTDQTVNAGQSATFTAAASGSPTPTVQWQFSTDGGATFQNVAGATTTTLTVPNVAAGQNGTKFRAVFTNSGGSATTTAATMTVNYAPTVATNPTSQSVSAGSTATFTAAANGNPTPTVQWQQSTDGGATFVNIAGATSTTLSFTTLASQNGNQYRAVFTNTVGSATTTAATLTVTAGPVITQNPTNQTVNAGQTATFTAAASGTPTPTVQWQFSTDGGATFQNVAGATTTTLTVPNVAAGQNGTKFRAVFTNSGGSATTTAATMTVNFAPTVTTNPVSQSVSAGSIATFTAAANGNPTPTVQWQQSTDGGATFQNVAGATSTTLSFTTLASQNGNQYRAVFTNTVGSATTTAATLTVTAGPVITQNPTNQTVNAGQTATFTAAASGTPTPTVQWQFSTDGGATFQNVAGAATTTLTVPNVAAGQNGTKFRAVFTNTSGSATTTAATLTVNFAPTVTTNPVSQSVSAGSIATFTAAANGNPTPTVQWQQSTDGGATFQNVAGATSTTLSFTTLASQNGNQYRAVFTNTVGSATTTAATLTVTAGPQITQNPTDQTVNAGQTAAFTSAASGSPTPTVQWQFSTDGGATFQNVAGATATTLTVPNVAAGQNGTKFRAVFTNSSGSATTTAATLTVNNAPTVTTNPTSQSISAGSSVSFTAAASGNPAPTVQWQQSTDGGATFTDIAGATSTPLSFTALASQNGNQYRAVFTNTVGSATTTAATLTVASTMLQSSLNPSMFGQSVTFTATISGQNPTGTVTFTSGALTLCTAVALTANVATCATTALPVGSDSVTAAYSGDANNAASQSPAFTQTVNVKTTTVSLVVAPDHIALGQPVTITATVAGDPPTGTVTFTDNGNVLPCSPVTLVPGAASSTAVCTTVPSGTGTHSIAAIYSGDGSFAGATSSVAALVVGADATPAPTLDRWALLMLVGLLGATAFVRLRRL